MNKLLSIIAVLILMASPVLASGNGDDLNVIVLPLGTTIAGDAASSSAIVSLPQSIVMDSVQVINRSAVTANSTNYLTIELMVNGASYGTFTSSDTAMVADTPLSLTPTTSKVSQNDEVSARLEKEGSGQVTTNAILQINYHNAQ